MRPIYRPTVAPHFACAFSPGFTKGKQKMGRVVKKLKIGGKEKAQKSAKPVNVRSLTL